MVVFEVRLTVGGMVMRWSVGKVETGGGAQPPRAERTTRRVIYGIFLF